MSVAKIWMSAICFASVNCSMNSIAKVYVSSPVAQAGVQTRMVRGGAESMGPYLADTAGDKLESDLPLRSIKSGITRSWST